MPELIFIHIPKNAGISFWQTLREVYGENNIKQIWHLLPYSGDLELGIAGSDLFRNHAKFRKTVNESLKDIDFPVIFGHMPVWILEDLWPGVPRVVFVRNPVDQVLSRVFHWRKENLYGVQSMTPRQLALSPIFRNNQSLYTGDSLKPFTHVGIVEDYENSFRQIAGSFGWENVQPWHDHTTNHENDMRQELREDVEFCRELEEVNYRDMALYDWAVNR